MVKMQFKMNLRCWWNAHLQ